jgi:hypothetical protein
MIKITQDMRNAAFRQQLRRSEMGTQTKTISFETSFEVVSSNWRSLFKLCGAAALILLVYSLVTMVLLITIGGQPTTAQEGFTMLQNNRLVGLLRLDVLTLIFIPLYYPLFLGLYAALPKTHGATVTLASVFVFAGLTLFLSTPSVLSWLALSDRFAAATSEAQKDMLLGAGEAILAADMWHSSGAVLGGILMQMGALMVSAAMLGSKIFVKATASVGLLTHGLDLARILISFLFPTGGILLMAVAGPLYLVWFPLLARDFFRLGRSGLEG